MDVSIIIPVYKVEKYITRCIQSIMNQSCKNIQIECIIIDDCTPDASIDIVNGVLSDYKGDVKFIILRHEKNSGLSAARNTGIKASTGRYLMFVDSDDYITDDAVSKLWNAHLTYQHAELIVATYYSVKDSCPFDNGIDKQTLVDGKRLRKMLMNYQVTCNACWRLIPRELIINNKLFFTPGLLYEDILWCHRLFALVESAVVLPDVVYYYENNPNSITNTTKEKAIRSVRSYAYNCDEMLKKPYKDVYVDHQLYVLTFLMRALDTRRDYKVRGEVSKKLNDVRFRLVRSTLSEGRLLLGLFFLITYQPLYSLFSCRWFRSHYYMLESFIRHRANFLDSIFHRNN